MTTARATDERFWSKVAKGDGCWDWTASLFPTGYGQFRGPGGRPVLAHRFAYEQLVGAIPEGMVLDHLCRNRACVNPAHLEVVSDRENVARGEGWTARNARKTHCPHGHPYSPENTYNHPAGRRECRTCRRERQRSRARRSAA